jgi:hypothetical protein
MTQHLVSGLFSLLSIGFVESPSRIVRPGTGVQRAEGDIAKPGVLPVAVVPAAASMLHRSWLRG